MVLVKEFKTDGPVTKTLIPMAALDDIVGVIVFFSVIAVVSANISGESFHIWMIAVIVLLPLLIGALVGIPSAFLLKNSQSKKTNIGIIVLSILLITYIGYLFNTIVMPKPILNFMLMGMAFSAAFSNIVEEEKLNEILTDFSPILGFSMIAVTTLSKSAPESAQIIQGTIAAAAVINEIIAVIMAKKGFEWAGEFNKIASWEE